MPTAKADRIELRVTPEVKSLLTAAAQARQTTVSDFLLRHGIEAAEGALTAQRVFYADETAWLKIQTLVQEPAKKPAQATLAWLKKPRKKPVK